MSAALWGVWLVALVALAGAVALAVLVGNLYDQVDGLRRTALRAGPTGRAGTAGPTGATGPGGGGGGGSVVFPITVESGGTSQTSLDADTVLLGNGTNPVGFAVQTVKGQPLVSATGGSPPLFSNIVAACREVVIVTSSRTLQLSDANCMLRVEAATDVTLTVPAGVFPLYTEIDFLQYGPGTVTLDGSPVTLHAYANNLRVGSRYSGGTLKRFTDDDVWVAVGNLTAIPPP
jgi:hypothetical protein